MTKVPPEAHSAMTELPVRFINHFTVAVATSDWREHSDPARGERYLYGSGIAHHDIVNIPFYGRMYDTAVIAHPLCPSDCLLDPRVKVTHLQYVMIQLRDIQRSARADRKTTVQELRARQGSIEVLKMLRQKAIDRLSEHRVMKEAGEALRSMPPLQRCRRDSAVSLDGPPNETE